MSLSNVVPGANFTKYIATINPPYIELADGYYLFGSDFTTSKKNRVPGTVKPDLTELGAPTYGAAYAAIDSASKGFDSSISGGTPHTHIIIATRATGSSFGAVLCGHYKQSPTSDKMDGILDQQTGNLNYLSFVDGSVYGGVVGPATSDYVFVASAYDGSAGTTMIGSAGAISAMTYTVADPTLAGVRSFLIGASGYTGVGGSFNVAACLEFPIKLTKAQVADIYGYLRKLLPTRGITLV